MIYDTQYSRLRAQILQDLTSYHRWQPMLIKIKFNQIRTWIYNSLKF